VEDGLLWRTNPAQRFDDSAVSVAVVNLHSEAVLLGDIDVRLEGSLLGLQPLALGAKEVESGLADGTYARPAS
jgi:hypothetical protein